MAIEDPEAARRAKEAGERLRQTRNALGYSNRSRFAQIIDEDGNLLAKYEYGEALVPPAVVEKLHRMFFIPYEWIYEGNPARLPGELLQKVIGQKAS